MQQPEETPAVVIDSKSALRLVTMQATGLSIEQDLIEPGKVELQKMKGVCAGLAAAEQLVKTVQDTEVMRAVDAGELDGEIAKVVLAWLERTKVVLRETCDANRVGAIKYEAQIEGYGKVVDHIEQLYQKEELKAKAKLRAQEIRDVSDDGYVPPARRDAAEETQAPEPPAPKISKRVPRKVQSHAADT